MHHIARNLILAFVIAALARLDAPLRAAPPINSNRQDWITQYVEDDVVNALSQLYVVTRGDSSKFGDDPRLELRTGDLSKRISRMSASIGLGSRFNLTDEQQRNIGSLLDGAYLLAWTNGAGRCSNVLKFVIDSHHKPTDEPVLRLTQLEPARRGQMGQLVVTACWRIAAEGAPTQSQLAFATVILDGKEFNPREEISIGPYRPIRIGETWSQMVALDEYDLKTDAGQAHQIAVRVSTFQTKPQLLKADTPLAARGGTPARRRAADFARDRGGEMTSIEAKYAELRQRRARAKDASDARASFATGC
jgi:hypothetical protein